MAVKIRKDYYIKRKPKLIKDFSKEIEVARDMLKRKFSDAKINEFKADLSRCYENLILGKRTSSNE